MQAIVTYRQPTYSWHNDAFLGWEKRQESVSVEDGGAALGALIIGLLAGSAVIDGIEIS